MQRLFSLFPHGAPGIGLVLLRVAVCMGLILFDPASLFMGGRMLAYVITTVLALSLLAGLCTPWSSLACCLAAIAILARTGLGAASLVALLFGFSAAALMLLGPGAYSLDAVLFGRRLVRIHD